MRRLRAMYTIKSGGQRVLALLVGAVAFGEVIVGVGGVDADDTFDQLGVEIVSINSTLIEYGTNQYYIHFVCGTNFVLSPFWV